MSFDEQIEFAAQSDDDKAIAEMRGYNVVCDIVPCVTPEFYDLIDQGWRTTYAALFGESFVSVLGEHHAEAIEWHWNARIALLTGNKPDYWSYFPIWSRGHMKSTTARRIAVVEALLSVAFHEQAYVLYVSRNKEMAIKHAQSIETLLGSQTVRKYCPAIARVKKNVMGESKGWKASFLNTEAGVVFHFAGLDEGLAGGNVDDVRPTYICADDIDGREDSPVEGENRFQKLTTEVLPMRQSNTLQFWAQNLISRYTAMYRIQSGMERVLTNRKPTVPIPAILNPVYGVKTENGIVKDVLISGTPTWKFYSLERCQEEIDTIGLEAFKRECQHEVEQSKDGLIAHKYDDSIHVISQSEFAAVYGSRQMPKDWAKWHLNDWANTKTDKHANVAAWLTVSSQGAKFPGFTFIFSPMSFPKNAEAEDVAERFLSQLTPFAYRRVTWGELRRDAMLRLNADRHVKTLGERVAYERGHLQKIVKGYAKAVLKAHNVKGGTMGHSDTTVNEIYRDCYAMNFKPVNPGKTGGIDKLNQAMAIDATMPHPFRPQTLGYTRWFIVAPDDPEDKSARINPANGNQIFKPKPYPMALRPHDLYDDDLIRYQLSNWRWRDEKLTAAGATVGDPLKMNDDFGQMFQMFYFSNTPKNEGLSEKDYTYEAMAKEYKEIHDKPTRTKGEQLAFDDHYRETNKKVKKMFNPNLNTGGSADDSDAGLYFENDDHSEHFRLQDLNGFEDV